jgi:flagellar motor switch protein FliN/FliY
MAEDTPVPVPGTPEPVKAEVPPAVAPVDPAARAAEAAAPPGGDPSSAVATAEPANPDALDQISIEELLKQASFDNPAGAVGAVAAPEAADFKLQNFPQVLQDAPISSIELLRDVELNVKIELGRSRMLVEDVLKLGEGSVVELDKLAGDPVDVFVNDRLVARGEVLVLNDNFCVRVNEIVAGVKEEGL